MLLEYLIAQDSYVTIKEIAKYFDVSERKIRYCVNYLNDILLKYDIRIESSQNHGVIINDYSNLNNFIEGSEIIFSQNERLIEDMVLLYKDGFVDVHQLQVYFNISKQTVYHDIKKLKETLLNHGIHLKSDKGTFFIDDDTKTMIDALISLLGNIRIRKQFYERLKPNFYVSEYLQLFSQISNRNILKDAYEILPVLLDVFIGKKLKGIQSVDEDPVVNKLCTITSDSLGTDDVLSRFIVNFVMHFSRANYIDTRFIDIDIDALIKDLIKTFHLDRIADEYNLRFLKAHLIESVSRVINKEDIANEFKNEIITCFPLTYALTRDVLIKYLPDDIDSNEVAYITMYVKSMMDQGTSLGDKLKIAIVCNYGHSTSMLLLNRLRSYFGEESFVGPYSSKEFSELKAKNDFDLVISTVSIKDYSTVIINPLLPMTDIRKLEEIIQKKEYDKQCRHILKTYEYKNEFLPLKLKDLIKKNHISVVNELNDWREAIRRAADPLLEDKKITKSYIEKMIWSVETFGTYMVILPKIAFVHADVADGVFKRGMSLLKMNHPIIFGVKNTDLVQVIIVIASTDKEDFGLLKIVHILENEESMNKLFNAKTVDDILEI